MRFSVLVGAVGGLFVLGCADMLGLGGLTYDRGAGEVVAQTGGAGDGTGGAGDGTGGEAAPSGDGDGHLSLGGGGPVPAEEPDSFSIVLDRSALIAASPRSRDVADYFFFDPERGELSFRRQDEYRSEEIGAWDFPAPDGLSHLTVVPYEGGMTVVGYDSVSGFTSHALVSDRGDFEIVSTDVGTSGRSTLSSFFAGGPWALLAYSSSDGNYRYFKPAPAEESDLFAGQWDPGWTTVLPFFVGDDSGVLKFDSATSRLQFDRFTGFGQPLETVFELTVSGTFSHMETYGDAGSGQRREVLFYQNGSGVVVTGYLEGSDAQFRFIQVGSGFFRGDLTQIVALSSVQKPRAFTFSASSGQAVLRDLSPDDLATIVVR